MDSQKQKRQYISGLAVTAGQSLVIYLLFRKARNKNKIKQTAVLAASVLLVISCDIWPAAVAEMWQSVQGDGARPHQTADGCSSKPSSVAIYLEFCYKWRTRSSWWWNSRVVPCDAPRIGRIQSRTKFVFLFLSLNPPKRKAVILKINLQNYLTYT